MTREEHYKAAENHLSSSVNAIQMLNDFFEGTEGKSNSATEPMSNGVALMLIMAVDALTHATLANCRVREVDKNDQ
jgi:hypothetical protein